MLAQELGSLLRENLSPRGPAQALLNESLSVSQHQPRTLMLIFDRSADMAPPLQVSALCVYVFFLYNLMMGDSI